MKRTRVLSWLLLGMVPSLCWAQDTYFGIYLQGGKVGYSVVRQPLPPDENGQSWSVSETVFRSALLGTDLDMKITSRTLQAKDGRPVQMEYVTESSGRTQIVSARFEPTKIVASIDNNGTKTTRELPIPAGARVVDDATSALILSGPGASSEFKVHVLDPTTVTLIENKVRVVGPTRTDLRGEMVNATLVVVTDPRATTRIFYSAKGDVLKIEGPLGMLMLPEDREVAMATPAQRTDLGFTSALRVVPPLESPMTTVSVEYRVTGVDLSRAPSDAYQTIRRDGTSWRVAIHPVGFTIVRGMTIQEASKTASRWTRPSLHIPSDAQAMKDLARQIVGTETNVLRAADRINRWVDRNMRENAGIGVLRDATEVLATKEGVCRDYAILAATLMRAAGIPTRVVSGLIYDQDQMFYHAWVEVWSGRNWLMLDPTRADHPTNATRLKLAHGNVEDAFAFPVLERVEFKVLTVKTR